MSPGTEIETSGRRRPLRPVIAAVLGMATALLGLAVVPATTGPAGPTQVSLRLVPGDGRSDIQLTPLGTIGANTHVAPARVELALVEANIEALATSATSPSGRAELRREVTQDLQSLALKATLQTTVTIAIVTLAVAALLLGRHLAVLGAALAGSIVGLGLVIAAIFVTFDIDAFREPSYSGALEKAEQVIEVVTRSEEVLDRTRSRFEIASSRVSDLLVLLAQPDPDPAAAQTVILHVSDIHANPIGFEVAQNLAREFDVDAVVDTGDISAAELDTGPLSSAISPIDDALAREIADVGVPYIFVPGNHDSPELRRRLERVDNFEELDGTSIEIGSVTILGFADPTFSRTPVPEDEKSEARALLADDLAVEADVVQPDVIAVHDQILASESDAPLVIAGHVHERVETTRGDTLVLTVGSTGATGLKHLTVEAGRNYEAQILYFEQGALVAVDYVSFEDIGGDFELDRRTYAGSG